MDRRISLTLDDDLNKISELTSALNSKIRLNLIRLLMNRSYSINELAERIKLPISTTSFHLRILKNAGLIMIVANPSKKGNEKIVSHIANYITFDFEKKDLKKSNFEVFNIPIGGFDNANVVAPCGLADANGIILLEDDEPGTFHSPLRHQAQLVWFTDGYVEYKIPNYRLRNKTITAVTFSMEFCSECPNYRENWKSDITFWINNHEICTYQSPGDFGKHRGQFSPKNWSSSATQHGLLKHFKIDSSGTYMDEYSISSAKLDDLNLLEHDYIVLKVGFKDSSKYIGGINIFGSKFGNHEQDIVFGIEYAD